MSDLGSVERFYGRWAALYDLLATRTPGIGTERERTVGALALSPGDTVVEMGCGTGANFPFLRDRVGEAGQVVGVDLTPGVLARARRRIDRAGWENVHVVRGDATQPPIGQADAILGTFVVGMFADPTSAVAGWADLVEPGGRVALLDAVPRESRTGPLDAAFRAFVAISARPRPGRFGTTSRQPGCSVSGSSGRGTGCPSRDRSQSTTAFAVGSSGSRPGRSSDRERPTW